MAERTEVPPHIEVSIVHCSSRCSCNEPGRESHVRIIQKCSSVENEITELLDATGADVVSGRLYRGYGRSLSGGVSPTAVNGGIIRVQVTLIWK